MSTIIGSGFTEEEEGGGSAGDETKKLLVDDTVVGVGGAAAVAAVAVLLAALITDLKLKMLLRPVEVVFEVFELVPDALARLTLS